jgi:hypothetical protein
VAILLAASASGAGAQSVLYKWMDADGKTQYSDKPPKNYKGTVTRLETEAFVPPLPNQAPVTKKADAARAADDPAQAKAPDLNTARREMRAALGANVSRARENLELAQKALADAAELRPEDMQVVRNRADNTGGRAGPQVGRSNCRQAAGADGKMVTFCPGVVPTAEHGERMAQLEQAVREAEEALSAAQEAYRRGVD